MGHIKEVVFPGNIPARGQLGRICTDTHQAYQKKRLNYEELQYLMYDLLFEHLEEMRPKPLPSEPLVLAEFKRTKDGEWWSKKTLTDKEALGKKIYEQQEVKDYFDKYEKVLGSNIVEAVSLERAIVFWLDVGEVEKARVCWKQYKFFQKEYTMVSGVSLWKQKTVEEMGKDTDVLKGV